MGQPSRLVRADLPRNPRRPVVAGWAGSGGPDAGFGAIFGLAAILVLPILYGCMGFVMTAIMAMLYNALSGMVGGIEVDVA